MGLVSPARVPYRTVLAAWWIFKFPTLPPSIRILFVADDAIAFRFPAVAYRGSSFPGSLFLFRAQRVPLPGLSWRSAAQLACLPLIARCTARPKLEQYRLLAWARRLARRRRASGMCLPGGAAAAEFMPERLG